MLHTRQSFAYRPQHNQRRATNAPRGSSPGRAAFSLFPLTCASRQRGAWVLPGGFWPVTVCAVIGLALAVALVFSTARPGLE